MNDPKKKPAARSSMDPWVSRWIQAQLPKPDALSVDRTVRPPRPSVAERAASRTRALMERASSVAETKKALVGESTKREDALNAITSVPLLGDAASLGAAGARLLSGDRIGGAMFALSALPFVPGPNTSKQVVEDILKGNRYAILSAENAAGAQMTARENAERMSRLRSELIRRGYKPGTDFVPTVGRYKDFQTGNVLEENGFLIRNMPEREAKLVGARFGQTSVMTQAGYHDIKTGQLFPTQGTNMAANDLPYSEAGGVKFDLQPNFDAPAPASVKALPVPKNANPEAMRLYDQLREDMGREAPKELKRVKQVDPQKAALMAHAYTMLKSAPDSPEVRDAYKALTGEVKQQLKAIEDAGYKIEYVDADPYKNSAELFADLRDNRRMRVLKTNEDSAHPILSNEENDQFRAVHDFLAHGAGGNQFGPLGEERAYRIHAGTLSPQAQRALATETRGQNSWVNFGPHADKPVGERPFAQQKAGLWPEALTGEYDEMPAAVIMSQKEHPKVPLGDVQFATKAGPVDLNYFLSESGDLNTVGVRLQTKGAGALADEELWEQVRGALGISGVRSIYRQMQALKPESRSAMGTRVTGTHRSDYGSRRRAFGDPKLTPGEERSVAPFRKEPDPLAGLPLLDTSAPQGRAGELQKLYGTDEALGVTQDAEGLSVLPNGLPASQCTNCADHIYDKEPNARVVGFFDEENPGTAVGKAAGGHDFAIVDDRYIVDPWVTQTENLASKSVFDLEDPADADDIKRLYGNPSRWKDVAPQKTNRPQQVRTAEPVAPAIGYTPEWMSNRGTLFDYRRLGQDPIPVEQRELFREQPRNAQGLAAYMEKVDKAMQRLASPETERLLTAGLREGGDKWYYLDPLAREFMERHGEEEGLRRFRLYTRMVGATSPNSDVEKNIARAGALFPHFLAGETLAGRKTLNDLFTPEQALGSSAHRAHTSMLQRAAAGEGRMAKGAYKGDSFDNNLFGNFAPLTGDRHWFRQALGEDKANPLGYVASEDVGRDFARREVEKGRLEVPEGRDPTAPYQSSLWIGDALGVGTRVKSPPVPALRVFENQLQDTAHSLGIRPSTALRRFVDGTLWEFAGGVPGLKR